MTYSNVPKFKKKRYECELTRILIWLDELNKIQWLFVLSRCTNRVLGKFI